MWLWLLRALEVICVTVHGLYKSGVQDASTCQLETIWSLAALVVKVNFSRI